METYLAMDIGAGTQDILLFDRSKNIENCMKVVAPSRATLLAGQVSSNTGIGRDIFLTGTIMGSRFLATAVKKHIASGYRVYATPMAAKTFRDNPDRVRAIGIDICETPPHPMTTLELGDIDLPPLLRLFAEFEQPAPSQYFIAVQDHGECLEGSNRQMRMSYFRSFLDSGGLMRNLLFSEIPPIFTRMLAVRDRLAGSLLMDTGPAALMGSLYDPLVRERAAEGAILINVGNQHTLAALVREERVLGIMEHHTCFMNREKISSLVEGLKSGRLTNEEIFNEKGHGCAIHDDYRSERPFQFVSVTGPQRYLAGIPGYHQAAPFGDMMLTGCFGLLGAAGLLEKSDLPLAQSRKEMQ